MPMDITYWLQPLDALHGNLQESIAYFIIWWLLIAGWFLPTIIAVKLGIKTFSWKFWLILFLNGPVGFFVAGWFVTEILYPME